MAIRKFCFISITAFLFPLNGYAADHDILSIAEGVWELDPSETEDVHDFTCGEHPLQIKIDKESLRYQSERDGFVSVGNILDVQDRFFWLQYDDEKRLDDEGKPLVWAFVLRDENHFYWKRKDNLKNRTTMRKRCESD